MWNRAWSLSLVLLVGSMPAAASAQQPKIKILFLGDNGHHQPQERFRQIEPVLAERGIRLEYADSAKVLNPETLARFDGLLIYANIEKITPAQEQALLDYVAGGKGFIPIHCASFCFLNSPRYVELVGAQFKTHGKGTFRTVGTGVDHPIMRGMTDFESWDETYVHHRHNEKDRTVLSYRVDKKDKEPWTWVRTHGKGRVFYTAWGHDDRTWGNPGFQTLLERGIRWAVGEDPGAAPSVVQAPAMTPQRKDVKPFAYKEAKVPFYPAGKAWGTNTAVNQMQLPLEPAESQKHFVTPVQLDVKLFAAEPQIRRPICMNWDERGRLWIAETVDYPNNIQRSGEGHDRIVICEDTDGDGVADKFTVFADKLSIPTSFLFYKNGIIVMQAPDTLYLQDTDGDGKADKRTVLFSGWNTYDTHAGPSNLRWGFDNWVYGMVGYSGFNGTVGGERHSFRQGFFRFRPDGSKLEFLRSTNNNSWGVGFSEEGLLFGSTANGNPSIYMPIPNRYYEQVRGWSSRVLPPIAGNATMHPITDKVRQVDYHGKFTAAAGHALYTARVYPPEYWNRAAFVSEPTGHLVATFQLQKQGSHFTSRNAWNLLASDDEWSAPIMAEVGPDGNVWVIDWYNYIVQHNPTPTGFKTGRGAAYETDLRDKTHGRVYRLVAKDAKPAPPTTLKDAPPEKLLAALATDNLFWRLHAQRLLVERGQRDVVPELVNLASDLTFTDAIGLAPAVIHALWTLHGLGALDGSDAMATAAVVKTLRHKSAGVRRNAVLVLPRNADAVGDILAAGLLDDPDAQVRLATLLALAEMPPDAKVSAPLAQMLTRPENSADRWIPDAATSAAARHALPFIRALAADKKPLPTRVTEVVTVVAEHMGRTADVETVDPLLAAIAGSEPAFAEIVLTGLAKGWPRGKKATLTATTTKAAEWILQSLSPAGKAQMLRLAASWDVPALTRGAAEAAKNLLAVAADENRFTTARVAAARQYLELLPGDGKAVEQLLDLITPRTPPAIATGVIEAIGVTTAPEAGPALVNRMGSLSPTARAAAVRVLLGRGESTRALLDALDKGTMQLGELTLDQKEALAAHPDTKIAARAKTILARGGGLPSADRQKVIDELIPLLKRTGNPELGKFVFKKNCATCHVHGGEGNKVGPDLTGMATHPKAELLVNIMDPSRSVEGNYRVYTVSLLDGRVLSGLLASETKTSIEIIDTEAKKHVIQRDAIDDLAASNKSLMPDGFEKTLSAVELVNLLEFLTQRGQYLPISLAKAATITSARGMFYGEDRDTERLIFRDWSPHTFKGVPFHLVDPRGGKAPNVIMLYAPQGELPPKMPKSVRVPCNAPARTIHLLSGVSGWGYPYGKKGGVVMTVRLRYGDGKTEDHALVNGEHFADYIRRVDVPGSEFAYALRGQQIRYLAITPKRADPIAEIEFVKGPDPSAPVIMAVTVETR
jgi:putative membrane-bound dehydrogenase-like protein